MGTIKRDDMMTRPETPFSAVSSWWTLMWEAPEKCSLWSIVLTVSMQWVYTLAESEPD